MRAVSGKYVSRAAIAFVSASLFGWPAVGAETAVPDFSGIWGRNWPFLEVPPSGPGPVVGNPRRFNAALIGDHTNQILKPEAAALLKKKADLAASGVVNPDPHNQCGPEPTPFLLSIQYGMKILQHKDGVTMLYIGDNKVRHIRLNEAHPANLEPTWEGHSVGHYEGDTLVVDSVGFKVGPLSMVDTYNTPHTEALHVIERYRLIDGEAARDAVRKHEGAYFPPGMSNPTVGEYGRGLIDTDLTKKGLQVEITVEDPGVFTTPWKALVTYRPTVGDAWPEAICADNTFDPFDNAHTPVPQTDKRDF